MKSLQTYLPILDWLPNYERSWLRTDLMAGLAVWAMTVPKALSYAGIANYPFAAVNALVLMLAMMIGVVIIMKIVDIRKQL